MYEDFYGLKEKPFNLNPDPDFLYMSPGHENVYTHLEYAIQESKGFVVVTGEIGSGKTTLINYLLRKIPQTIHVGIINNTIVQPHELLKMICNEYELPVDGADKTQLLTLFYNFLLDQYSHKERVVLIIDEAQNLPEKSLEEIRMLSNLESEKHHLVQMILVGQPQLRDRLRKKSLEQFVQRVTVYCHLDGLDKVHVTHYIHHRLQTAGADSLDLFDDDAIKAIYKHSSGIPRLINTLCDAALVYGYADDVKVIGKDLIETVAQARSLDRGQEAEEPAPEGVPAYEDLGVSPSMDSMKKIEERMRVLEERLAFHEESTLRVGQKLEALQNQRDERDKILIQLFKMLKRSMEGRANLIAQVNRMQSQLKFNKSQTPVKSAGVTQSILPISQQK